MKKSFLIPLIFLNTLFTVVVNLPLQGQQVKILTYEDAIHIALQKSYTVKSHWHYKIAMQHYFSYRKAMFKPRLDFEVFTPSWNEQVVPIERTNALPVYNSLGLIRYGGLLQFTYMLPTGGYFALSSTMYKENLNRVLALENYISLKSNQAYSSIGLSFNQPIFTTNTLKQDLNEAKYQFELYSSHFTRGQMDIIYNVTEGFYNLYRATRQVEIAREKLKNSQEAYRIAQLKVETGRIPEGDVLIAEVAAAQNRANLSESEGNLERAKDDFKQLIGLSLDEDIQILTDLKYDTFNIDLNKAINEALKNRLEIYEDKLDIELQEIAVDRAKQEREFKGNISAYYDFTGVSTLGSGPARDLFESSFKNFTERPPNRGITLTFSYPIFDWGRGSARVQRSLAYLKEAELSLENTKVTIIREVRDVVRTVEEAKNRLKIHEKNQKVAQRSYEISRLRFENGDISSQELAQEQERLASSQIDYLNAFITYQLAMADLRRKTMWDFQSNRSYLKDDYLTQDETDELE